MSKTVWPRITLFLNIHTDIVYSHSAYDADPVVQLNPPNRASSNKIDTHLLSVCIGGWQICNYQFDDDIDLLGISQEVNKLLKDWGNRLLNTTLKLSTASRKVSSTAHQGKTICQHTDEWEKNARICGSLQILIIHTNEIKIDKISMIELAQVTHDKGSNNM